jgi:uncharacterized membrane protein
MISRLINIVPARFRKLEYLYGVTSLIFGLVFIAIIPPGWSPDEPQHYLRVQSLAHGNVFADIYHGEGNAMYGGGPLSENTDKFIYSYGGTGSPNWKELRLHFPMTNNPGVFTDQKETSVQTPVVFSATSKNTPFVYLPYVIATWIGNSIGLPLLATFLLAKIFGLVTLTVAFFYAIRLAPKGKWLIFTIGLLPTTIVQSAAITADTMTLGACVLFIAFVMREAFSKTPISRWSYAILFSLVMAIGLVKASYLPITALLIIIPMLRKEYRSIKLFGILSVILVICALPGLLWVKTALTIPDYYPGNVIPSEQAHHIITHPQDFIAVLLSTYFSDDQQLIHRGFFGSFIWDTTQLPLVFNFAGIAALLLALFITSPREKIRSSFTRSTKLIMWSIFLLLSALITYALYIYYTPVGGTSANGIQGRYFLPFALLPLLAIASPIIPAAKQLWPKTIIYGLLFVMLLSSILVISERVYV